MMLTLLGDSTAAAEVSTEVNRFVTLLRSVANQGISFHAKSEGFRVSETASDDGRRA